MLRYYILTSRNLPCLKRHFHSVPKKHTTVVVNTTDQEYERAASEWCFENKINCVVTESNGKPGKGKNAVLDHFLDSSYDYMVQIDGDDFLQPHGVNLYWWLSENNPPDGVQIVYGRCWSGELENPDELYAPFPWDDNFKQWVENTVTSEERPHFDYMYEHREEYKELYDIHCHDNFTWNYPLDSVHFMDCARLIFWSRKLASSVRFREDLLIGEDALLNYEVRDMAWKKRIELRKVQDSREKTYSYDLLNSGIVKKSQRDANWEWLKDINEAIAEASKNWTVPQTFRLSPVVHNLKRTEELNLGDLNE